MLLEHQKIAAFTTGATVKSVVNGMPQSHFLPNVNPN